VSFSAAGEGRAGLAGAVGTTKVVPRLQGSWKSVPKTKRDLGADVRKPSEDGYILLGVLILLFIFVILMSVALPRIAASIQRDREVETMERGKQYIRAIQLYYRKFNAYPPSIDALVKTNEIRFLRKRYKDPMTGKEDWKPIAFCQNKAPIAMGFFGQPLGAASGCGVLAGTGPQGGNGLNGSNSNGSSSSIFGSNNNASNNSGSSIFSNNGSSSGGSGIGSNGSNGGIGSSSSGGSSGDTSASGQAGAGAGGTDANGNPTGSIFGSDAGPTMGGGGFVGVSPALDKASILTYKKKSKYNEWEFTYSPLMDQPAMPGAAAGGGLGNSLGAGQQQQPLNTTPPPQPQPQPQPQQ
jgi:type II secretory pathway pseudopilin PulG